MVGVNFKMGVRAGLASSISPVLVAGVLLFGAGEPSWSQEKIGGAQTVVNNVDGSLPTGNQVPVVQGDSVFLNEAVRSGADSRAKLVLNDSTNLSVGPDSTVKLDDFVYSGPKAPGTVALNMTKGTLRFITGDASKRAYTIWTPTAAIGVRGTIFRAKVTQSETQILNEEGTTIVCQRVGTLTAQQIITRFCSGGVGNQALPTHKALLPTADEISLTKSCPCVELLVPNQEATVTSNGITVTEAPLDAIPDPFAESFGFGEFSPFVGAGLLGAAAIAAIAAAESSHSSSSSSFVSQ